MSNNSNRNKTDYFNITMHCVAYINEIKVNEAKKKGGPDEVRVSLAVLYGNAKKPKKDFYSLSVSTEQARDVLRPVFKDINDENKAVFATVVISKGDSSPFMFESGKNEGKMGVTHFGSLLEIVRLKVDDDVVFTQNDGA